jgi:hypothetical protein
VNEYGRTVLKKVLKRDQVAMFFEKWCLRFGSPRPMGLDVDIRFPTGARPNTIRYEAVSASE